LNTKRSERIAGVPYTPAYSPVFPFFLAHF
jgi:hypothetical protein